MIPTTGLPDFSKDWDFIKDGDGSNDEKQSW
jgi:hypothetical protein